MIIRRLLRWSRKIHKWIGVYIGILTIIWLVEMIVLPPIFNPGLPVVDVPPSVAQDHSASLSLHHALQLFMDQQPDGIDSLDELDEMTYLPGNGIYRFVIKDRFLEWYVDSKTGKILEFGFNSNCFLTENGMLGWIHPVISKTIRATFEFSFVLIAITGLYMVFYPRKKHGQRLKSTKDDIRRTLLSK